MKEEVINHTSKPSPPANILKMSKVLMYIQSGNWKKLSKRLKQKREKDKEVLRTMDSSDERYPIHHACLNGVNQLGMGAILNFFPEAAKQKDDEGSTPLHYLMHYDDKCELNVLEMVLGEYVDAINMQDDYGCTPLFHAVEHNIGVRIEYLALLLRHDVGVDALKTPCNISHLQTRRKRRELVAAPLRNSFYPRNDTAAYRRTPLYMIWGVAMSASDTVRFAVRLKKKNRRERKKMGKRLEKAQMMLEAAYLNKTIDPTRFKTRFITVRGYDSFNLPLRRRIMQRSHARTGLHSNIGISVPSSGNIPPSRYSESPRRYRNFLGNHGSGRFSVQSARSLNNNIRSNGSLSNEYKDAREESRKHWDEIGRRDQFANLINIEDGENKFRVLHAVLTEHSFLPESAYDYAIVHYPEQVNETEEKTGNYPLHIAANMHTESDFDRDEILVELLNKNEYAAQRKNKAGQLPLHIALTNRDSWEFDTIKALVKSYPDAKEILDDSLNLYPFQIAALKKNDESDNELSIIYTLLIEAPQMISNIEKYDE